jgi:surface antigen
MKRTATALFLATLISSTAGAAEGPMGAHFVYGDWEKVKQAGREVLNARPDGVAVPWSNPDSASQGTVVAQESAEEGGKTCRTLRFEHVAGGQPETRLMRFCRGGDGAWISNTPGLVSNEPDQGRGRSVMFGDEGAGPAPLASIPASVSTGVSTGAAEDKCSRLSRTIGELEGRPQQRYVAIQEYEAECTRAAHTD